MNFDVSVKRLLPIILQIYQDEDFKFTLFAPNKSAMDEAREIIDQLIKQHKEPVLDFG